MEIVIRDGESRLIDGPVEPNDCKAVLGYHQCNTHLDGYHLATSAPLEDGSEVVLSRWPIGPAQPADLAARIRALVMEYAGRWADGVGADAAAFREVMSYLRDVFQSADSESATMLVGWLRTRDESEAKMAVYRQAADELTRIVRECEKKR